MGDKPQRVIATFSAPLTLLQSDSFQQLHSALIAQLPLRNLHWKSASRPSVRTIQELEIEFVPLDSIRDAHTSQVPTSLLTRPLLNIYFVICDDADAYRNNIRKQLKEWHASVSERKNQDWLIIHVERPDARGSSSGFFKVQSSVLDKIRTDFNSDKRDRCVQLSWSQAHENPAAWAEVINKLKECILSAFDSAVSQREEDVKRSEGQRSMPGWNFCTFFILKESLALSFEGVNLHEEALAQYDELETSFFRVLRERSLSWFGALISPDPKDENASLLALDKKPYRDMILSNTISVFDFRVYLLSRQSKLLGKLTRVAEVARKATSFVSAFGRRLREVEDLPAHFVELWSYSSALSVVEQCDIWAAEADLETAKSNGFNSAKAELLEVARKQLDVIGIGCGHLPSAPPFLNVARRPLSSETKENPSALLASLKDSDTFYDLYVSITNRAIDLYAKATRKKVALRLHGDLAALDLHRGRLDTALQTYTSLPAHYQHYHWTSLEAFMLARGLATHSRLEKSQDRDWVLAALSFLKLFAEDTANEIIILDQDRVEYVNALIGSLAAAAGQFETDLVSVDHPAFTLKLPDSTAHAAQEEDGANLSVFVENALPCDVLVDEIKIQLHGRDATRLSFTVASQTLKSGKNQCTVFCPTSLCGTYILEEATIRIAKVVLKWNYYKPGRSGKAAREKPSLVRVPKDPYAFDIQLQPPHTTEVGATPQILVVVSSGRNHIDIALIKLASLSGTRFFFDKAMLIDSEGATELVLADDTITLSDIPPNQNVQIVIPHSDVSSHQSMVVTIEADYATRAQPDLTRHLSFTREANTALPLQFNVQDFFRGQKLFSRFTVSTTSQQFIRIGSTRLEISEGTGTGNDVDIKGSGSVRTMVVSPAHPANFIFQIESRRGPVRDSLHLRVKYRSLKMEAETLIRDTVDQYTKDKPTLHAHHTHISNSLCESMLADSRWQDTYRMTGGLDMSVPVIGGLEEEDLDVLTKITNSLRNTPMYVNEDKGWREVIIPVDVPQMNILAGVRLSILPHAGAKEPSRDQPLPSFYAGQPISALLTIETTFHWSASRSENRTYHMRFDIEEMVRTWLVSGRKRGDFIAENDGKYSFPITLIALHHGELALPRISVTPLPLGGEMTMGSLAIPSAETYQLHGAEKLLILPRGGRSTFVVGMGSAAYE